MKTYYEYTDEDWSKLNGFDWQWLLVKRPQFAKHCDWSKLGGREWQWLLEKQPQFAEHCDWNKLDVLDWQWLLEKQPQLAEHCNWNKLDGREWRFLIKRRAKTGLNKNKDAQRVLATKHPDLFAKILPKNRDPDAQILFEMSSF